MAAILDFKMADICIKSLIYIIKLNQVIYMAVATTIMHLCHSRTEIMVKLEKKYPKCRSKFKKKYPKSRSKWQPSWITKWWTYVKNW